MNRQDHISTNIGTIISGVVLGTAIGFIAASVSSWFMIAAIAPMLLVGFAAHNFYKMGYIWGQFDELNRQDRSWGEIEALIDSLNAQKDDHK